MDAGGPAAPAKRTAPPAQHFHMRLLSAAGLNAPSKFRAWANDRKVAHVVGLTLGPNRRTRLTVVQAPSPPLAALLWQNVNGVDADVGDVISISGTTDTPLLATNSNNWHIAKLPNVRTATPTLNIKLPAEDDIPDIHLVLQEVSPTWHTDIMAPLQDPCLPYPPALPTRSKADLHHTSQPAETNPCLPPTTNHRWLTTQHGPTNVACRRRAHCT